MIRQKAFTVVLRQPPSPGLQVLRQTPGALVPAQTSPAPHWMVVLQASSSAAFPLLQTQEGPWFLTR